MAYLQQSKRFKTSSDTHTSDFYFFFNILIRQQWNRFKLIGMDLTSRIFVLFDTYSNTVFKHPVFYIGCKHHLQNSRSGIGIPLVSSIFSFWGYE